MKKTVLILLAALLLICAVSCSSAKNVGRLEINTKNIPTSDLRNAKSAKLYFFAGDYREIGHATIELDLKKVKDGSVLVRLPAGVYSEVEIVIDNHDDFAVLQCTKDFKNFDESGKIVINDGGKTYAKALDRQ